MEDNAPPHVHFYQREIYDFHKVNRILWPGNAPDLNAIEPTWYWLKRRTTLRGAPGDKKTAKDHWYEAWDKLPQHRIQEWIERIPFHIQEVIRLEGGNEYKEGKPGRDKRIGNRIRKKGYLSNRAYLEDDEESDRDREQLPIPFCVTDDCIVNSLYYAHFGRDEAIRMCDGPEINPQLRGNIDLFSTRPWRPIMPQKKDFIWQYGLAECTYTVIRLQFTSLSTEIWMSLTALEDHHITATVRDDDPIQA